MKLAKEALDVGLLTDDPAMIAFFEEEVGLGAPERLPIGGGVVQHRFAFQGSVVKVNVVPELPIQVRSGYVSVLLAVEGDAAPRLLRGPDDIAVERVSPGAQGVTQLGVRLRVPNRTAAEAYFRDALGWRVEEGIARLGRTAVLLEESAGAPSAVRMPVRGWTYLTAQVFDCDAETDAAVARGATLAAAPRTLGEVARFSMVSDPFGNPLEISERASLTGVPLRA